jgi:hypothetical protein
MIRDTHIFFTTSVFMYKAIPVPGAMIALSVNPFGPFLTEYIYTKALTRPERQEA